ncbi:MAG: hypothetical protein EBS51_14505, partial [Planctomycetia bacterium]|nr:hypothetical protein [Planctomycetia bacterium]
MQNRNIRLACALALLAASGTVMGDVVTLKSGSKVDGTILKRTDKRVWVDIGPEVLAFDMEDVQGIASAAAPVAARTEQVDLFHTATDLPTLSPKEHARILGPAVVKVSTPGGLGSGVIIDKEGHAITNAHVVQGEQKLK